MVKKYCIHPGFVNSNRDNSQHFIGYPTLIKLYKLNQDECINYDNSDDMRGRNYEDYIHLFPNSYGIYKIEGVK